MGNNYIDLPKVENNSQTGTVTSVGLSVPSALFTVTNSPVTSAGVLTLTLKTQVKNKVWAGPATGSDAAPTFRLLVAADLPAAGTTGQIQYNNAGAMGADTATTDGSGNITCFTLLGQSSVSSPDMYCANLNVEGSGICTIKMGQAFADTWNFNLPSDAGTAGGFLTSQGGGSTPMTWTKGASGSFTTADMKTVTVVNGLITAIV